MSPLLPYSPTSVLSSRHNHDECVNGIVLMTFGTLGTVGVVALTAAAAPEMAGAAAVEETAGGTFLTFCTVQTGCYI
jgi:hypothetical protein